MKIENTNTNSQKLTSHLGDSGMKNRPGINNVQGIIPARIGFKVS